MNIKIVRFTFAWDSFNDDFLAFASDINLIDTQALEDMISYNQKLSYVITHNFHTFNKAQHNLK